MKSQRGFTPFLPPLVMYGPNTRALTQERKMCYIFFCNKAISMQSLLLQDKYDTIRDSDGRVLRRRLHDDAVPTLHLGRSAAASER